jgi:vancomycin resistance protein YoaR
LLTLGLCAVSAVLAALAFRDRVLPGVQALGLDLGGLHRQEAGQRLVDRVDTLLGQRPILILDGREVDLPPHAFGERDTLAHGLLERALDVGRERPLAGMAVAARAATGGRTHLPPAPVDLAPLREALVALAEETDRPPQDAAIALRSDDGGPDGVSIVPGRAGRRLDVERTATDLAAAFVDGAAGTARPAVPATVAETPPAIEGGHLEPHRARLEAALARPLTVSAGSQRFAVERPARLLSEVEAGVPAGGAEPALRLNLDTPAFAALVTQVTGAAVPPRDARLEVQGDLVALVPDAPGATFERQEVQRAVTAALLAGEAQADLLPQATPATTPAASLVPLQTEANRIIAASLTIARGERRWTVARSDLARWLVLPAAGDAARGVRLDETRIRATLQPMAAETDRPPRDGRLEVQGGEPRVVPGEAGEVMDLAATVAAIQETLLKPGAGERSVSATVQPREPALTEARLEPARAQAVRIVGAPLTLRLGSRTWTISRDALGEMLLVGETAGSVTPYLSRQKLLERVQPVADEINPQLEQTYNQALKAWEQRAEERAQERALAREQESATGQPGAVPDRPPADDPRPRRQWFDLAGTVGALWAASTTDARMVELRLTNDDSVPLAPVPSAQAQAQAAGSGKWIAVNVTNQTLVAYEGDWPVFSGRVSTGLPRTPTPLGTFRVFTKLVADDMRGGSYAVGDYYYLPRVPWVMYFAAGGYAIHGTYWHSNFGNPMSHGCVNLETENARWLFEWAPMGTTVVVHR